MFVRGKVKVGWCGGRWRKGVAEWDILDYVHCLAAGLAGPKKRGWGRRGLGAQNSRSETLKHQRERHYPENKKTETSYTNTVNMHAHTHTGPDMKLKWQHRAYCSTTLNEENKQKTKTKSFTSFTDDLSNWSRKDNLRFLNCWSVPAADLHWWLLHNVIIWTQPLRYVHVLQGGECLHMHAWNECVWMC